MVRSTHTQTANDDPFPEHVQCNYLIMSQSPNKDQARFSGNVVPSVKQNSIIKVPLTTLHKKNTQTFQKTVYFSNCLNPANEHATAATSQKGKRQDRNIFSIPSHRLG